MNHSKFLQAFFFNSQICRFLRNRRNFGDHLVYFFFSTKTFLQNTYAGDSNSKKYTVRSWSFVSLCLWFLNLGLLFLELYEGSPRVILLLLKEFIKRILIFMLERNIDRIRILISTWHEIQGFKYFQTFQG